MQADLASVAIGEGHPVRLMGAINVSPESFYPGSVSRADEDLAARVRQMAADGADLIDVGAMSTAPYKDAHIDEAEERRRMQWAVAIAAASSTVPICADTQRASVAAVALAAGARVINDVSGLRGDPMMAHVAAQAEGLIVMANETGPSDEDPLELCQRLLSRSLDAADRAGISRSRIVVDPGIGFFRRARLPWDQFDVAVINGLRQLRSLGRPLLVGISRKSFIGKLAGQADTFDRLPGSLAATAVAVYNGAHMVRTHDIAETRDAVRVAEALRAARSSRF